MKNQFSGLSGKELVAAGHQFAKSLDADAPLIEIAKLFSEMASRLDCAIARGDELQQKLDAVAAENVSLRKAHPQPFGPIMMQGLDAYEKDRDQEPETGMLKAFFILRNSITITSKQTDAYLNSVRADSICSAIAECTNHCDTDYVIDAYDFSYEIAEMRSAGAIDLRDELVTYAKQLRSGTHDTADEAS